MVFGCWGGLKCVFGYLQTVQEELNFMGFTVKGIMYRIYPCISRFLMAKKAIS